MHSGCGECSVALAPKDAQQGQQILENIQDVQIDGQGGRDVVGFTAMNNLTSLKKY